MTIITINDNGEDEDDKIISFAFKIIYDLTKDIINEISELSLYIYYKVSDNKTIFYIGGFLNLKIINDSISANIYKAIPYVNNIRSNDSGNAVLKGAIMYRISS